jgi:pyruvate ferredoxin oxidoreductase beta subunit
MGIASEALKDFKGFTMKNIPAVEPLSSGHRACQGCVEILALRLALKAIGTNVIVASATGCMEIVTSPYPQTAWRVPWIHVAFENAAAVISGVESAYKVLARKGKIKLEEKVVFLAYGGDGGTADIGLQALSGALERGHDIVYICLDNEAYMNTGIQRSSSTPYGAMTTTSPPGKKSIGQATWKKNVPAIAAAHGIPYVATASPA